MEYNVGDIVKFRLTSMYYAETVGLCKKTEYIGVITSGVDEYNMLTVKLYNGKLINIYTKEILQKIEGKMAQVLYI